MSSRARQFEVLVVGAGPAGLAAAACAAESGRQVGLVDDNSNAGGQIWRGDLANPLSPSSQWMKRAKAAQVELFFGTRVFHQPAAGVLLAESREEELELAYQRLVIATGARERFLPFPGWTLPNVMGAGGLQAMVKSGLPIEGKRVVVAGSGPLLLAVAAYLKSHGARVLRICEQASLATMARFVSALRFQPHKIGEALSFRKQLSGVRYCLASWVIRAEGPDRVESVVVSSKGKLEAHECDYLACGFHLVPNTELALLLGCRLKQGYVEVDGVQQTSVAGIYCAGEPTGIGGLELSLLEGQTAGYAAAGRAQKSCPGFSSIQKLRKFTCAMDRAFFPRAELKSLLQPDTIVCRCEDVKFASLELRTSGRDAKLQTRCGMGPCQGRICGPATQFLFNWQMESVRPPIFPARYSSFITKSAQSNHVPGISGGD